jgi:lipopolysaccharide transport protein LptA
MHNFPDQVAIDDVICVHLGAYTCLLEVYTDNNLPVLGMIMEPERQIQYKSMQKTIICGLLTLTSFPCIADPLGDSAFDAISISADEAKEDERPGILHFEGHFQMRSSDWLLTSSQATVYGKPNKPDRIYLEGSPARFHVSPADKSEKDSIEAAASVVEYVRDTNRLMLSGGATLVLGEEVIRSTYIEYNIDTNRYSAGGESGVSIEVPPVD